MRKSPIGEGDLLTFLVKEIQNFRKNILEMLGQPLCDAPLPNPKTFKITKLLVWPAIDWGIFPYKDCVIDWLAAKYPEARLQFDDPSDFGSIDFASTILKDCGNNPVLILKAVSQLRKASKWCQAKTKWRNSIKAQKKKLNFTIDKYWEELKAEIALSAIVEDEVKTNEVQG